MLTHGALFNGIAGFPLAAAWAGIPTEWTVEIDEFCNKVSKKHFPDAIQYTDIHHATNLPYVDIISGGFPCQPFSVAGKQLGNEDDRALWPEMLRIIREVKPAYVIGENVAGLINLALDDVLASLEAEGYTTETFVVPACGVGAPHRRDRLWIIAYSERSPIRGNELQRGRQNEAKQAGVCCSATTNPNHQRCQECQPSDKPEGTRRPCRFDTPGGVAANSTRELPHGAGGTRHGRPESSDGSWRLTEPPVCGSNDGLSAGLVRNRGKQLKAYGNAIVPQVAFQIFQAIQQYEESRLIRVWR